MSAESPGREAGEIVLDVGCEAGSETGMPPEIEAVARRGFRIHPGLWHARCRAALQDLDITPERKKGILSYGPAVLKLARANKRSRVVLPLECWFEQSSGRWSTRRPCLHNITKKYDIRGAVLPAPGHVFVQGDYNSAHFLIAAARSGDPAALGDTARGDAYEAAVSVLVPELEGRPDDARTAAKLCILTVLNGGGGGPEGIPRCLAGFGVRVDGREAVRRKERWLDRYPDLREYLRNVPPAWTLPSGKVLRPDEGAGRAGLLWQSFEAEALLEALRRLSERPGWPVVFIAYDEILMEAPKADAQRAADRLQLVMDEALRSVVDLSGVPPERTVKVSIRSSWSGVLPASWPEDPGPCETIEGRRVIRLGVRVERTVAETIEAMRRLPDVFQCDGRLVRVADGPRIVELKPPALVTQMSTAVSYLRISLGTGGTRKETTVAPPLSLARSIADGGEYPGIRPLLAITTVPQLRPDGRVVCTLGYDEESGLWYAGQPLELPERPTLDDARKAADELLDVVSEFPFRSAADRSAWLAAVLSLVGRSLIEGPVPLFCGTANQARTGKTRVLTLAVLISTGQIPPTQTLQTYSEEEWDKAISSVVLGLNPDAVLIDNVPTGKAIGCATLDAILTAAGPVSIRRFGTSETPSVEPRSVWFATSNGASYRGDTADRTIPIRLLCTTPNPEARTFERADIMGHVRQRQPYLLACAFTMLRAWLVAGRPTKALPPLGSFEAWSAVVRQVLVWVGQPDPVATRVGVEEVDLGHTEHDQFVALAADLFGAEEWRTADLAGKVDGPRQVLLCDGRTRGDAQDLLDELGLWGPHIPTGRPPSARLLPARYEGAPR